MTVNEFVSLYRDSGCYVITIGDHYFNQQGWVNYSFPNLVKIPVTQRLIKSIKWKYLISVLFTELRRKNTYEFILHTSDYSIERFAKKIRNRIRKSLQNCTFKRPDIEDMLTHGLAINRQTLKRQHKRDKSLTDAGLWNRHVTTLFTQKNINMLGAYYAGRMVGYIVVSELEEKYIINHAFIDRNDSETTDPMNGLLYTMVNQLIEKDGSVKISYGLDSFEELHELNRFKNNMLFERIPVSRVYILHPVLLPLVKLIIFYNLHVLKRKSIKNSFTRKVIRLYQGHRMLFREGKASLV